MLMIHFFSISIIRAFYSQVFPTRLSALPSSHTLFSSLLQQPLKKYSHFTSALRMMSSDNRMMSPSAQRNAPHILNVFQQHVVSREDPGGAESIKILEIASGSGEHAVNIAGALGNQVTWQPTDVDESSLRSIQSWITAAGVTNVLEPFPLDVACFDPASFPVEGWSTVDGIVNINMVHISPWSCCEGLWRTAGALVRPGGFVYMYGPFCVEGSMVESNQRFDQSLRSRNPEWGVRNLEDICNLASSEGFEFEKKVEMPANNLSLIFCKSS